MKHWLLSILLILPIFAFAQDKKIEKEENIEQTKMPEQAQHYLLNNLPENYKRLRYYYETDGEEESYEAKFKLDGHRFSAEFNKSGKLEDIEVQLRKRNLDELVLQNIESFLESKHERFKIEKIQAQYLSKDEKAEKTMQRAEKSPDVKPDNFELIVATKNKGKLKKFEMLFDSNGNFEKEREIIRNSYDYLLF